jgi:DNA-binding transcriptional LysR family regulator
LIDDWFRRAGLASRPVMELGSIEALKELVAAGLGYSLVPGIAVATEHHRHGLRVQPLAPPLTRTLALVLRRDKPLSRPLQQVLEALRQLRR